MDAMANQVVRTVTSFDVLYGVGSQGLRPLMNSPEAPVRSSKVWAAFAVIGVVAVTAGVLWFKGQPLWCQCGGWSPWSGEIWSLHNSQHLFDPYSFTHVLHGVIFYGLLRAVLGEDRFGLRVFLATVIEAAWELVENSEAVINAYRESTISLDYFGDSVLNVVGDLGAMWVGFGLAAALPIWVSVAGFVATEVILALWIRDSLLLNILMLTFPIEAIKQWQLAGAP